MILHTEFARPTAWHDKAVALLGPTPAAALPNAARNRYATDLLLRIGFPEVRPDVVFLWYSDPDTTAHARGLDAVETRAALAAVDAEIGRVEDWLRAQGRLEATNLIVTSDHGFSNHTGGFDLPALVQPFVRTMADGTPDIVTAGGAVHFRSTIDPGRVATLVDTLQRHPAVGAIFTGNLPATWPRDLEPGTLSYALIGWSHARAGQMLVSAGWSDGAGPGPRGQTTASGRAGHGSTSPYEVTNTLIVAGPDFRARAVSDVATGNVDITPTLVRLTGLAAPAGTFDGRVIEEALRDGRPGPPGGIAGGLVGGLAAGGNPGGYSVREDFTEAYGVRYFASATATRQAPR